MDEHIEVSKKYPQVVLNTTYAFGIHDEDFVLAFEVDDIRDFQDLIMDLRETRVSTYVKNDISMIVCVKKDIIPLITSMRNIYHKTFHHTSKSKNFFPIKSKYQ